MLLIDNLFSAKFFAKDEREEKNYYLANNCNTKSVNSPIHYGYLQAIMKWDWDLEEEILEPNIHLALKHLANDLFEDTVNYLSKFPKTDIFPYLYLAKIYLNENSPKKNFSLGFEILEKVILECGTPPEAAFNFVNLKTNDETIIWLQSKVENIEKPIIENYLIF